MNKCYIFNNIFFCAYILNKIKQKLVFFIALLLKFLKFALFFHSFFYPMKLEKMRLIWGLDFSLYYSLCFTHNLFPSLPSLVMETSRNLVYTETFFLSGEFKVPKWRVHFLIHFLSGSISHAQRPYVATSSCTSECRYRTFSSLQKVLWMSQG